MEQLRQIFITESRENLQRCLDYLSQLKTLPDNRLILQALLLQADNLCEPALVVGLPAVFEVAHKFRLFISSMSLTLPVAEESLQQLEYFCHLLQSMLVADVGSSTLTAKDILAHDLKSPLGIIKATVENLLLVASPENTGALQRILRQANKGLQLLNHWLQDDGEKQAYDERQPLDVQKIAQECCEGWQSLAQQKTIRLLVNVEVSLIVRAHALYLSQILSNLLGNAIKFSKAGGLIEIHAAKARLPGSEVPAVLFRVIDQGRGIEEQHLPYIFLQRTQVRPEDRQQGSGLGLAICKKLCEWHGGTIWVQSRLNQGSTFCFVIPDR